VNLPVLFAIFLAGQLLLEGTRALAEDTRVSSLVQQSDASEGQRDPRAALAALHQAETIEPENFGVLLRISKQYSDLIDRTKDKKEAKAFAERAVAYGKRALALDGKCAKAHLNLAICYGKLTDYVGNKTKMEYAKFIRDETQRSIELDGTDDYAWHVMGRWHAGVAGLNGVLKTLASLVYGGLPPASMDEAVRCLKKAGELAPQRLMHRAELAKVYQAMGKSDLAAQQWQNVLGIRPLDSQDQQYQKEAKTELEKLQPSRGGDLRGVAKR
jgi:tetratricopeptide (TPR) repeat protein